MKKIILLMTMLMLMSANAYAEDPTPEQILQKVADNCTKINDMTADMINTITIHANGQPEKVNGPFNRKSYEKKPDKSKIEDTKDNSFDIVNGNDVYIGNPKIGVQQMRLDQDGIFDGNQLDVFYETEKAFEKNTFQILDHTINNGKNIFKIEMVSKNENKIYKKMIFEINYDEGLLLRDYFYNASGILTIMTEQMEYSLINGILIAVKVKETKYYSDGYTENVINYGNIQLNTGLPDSIFLPTETK